MCKINSDATSRFYAVSTVRDFRDLIAPVLAPHVAYLPHHANLFIRCDLRTYLHDVASKFGHAN